MNRVKRIWKSRWLVPIAIPVLLAIAIYVTTRPDAEDDYAVEQVDSMTMAPAAGTGSDDWGDEMGASPDPPEQTYTSVQPDTMGNGISTMPDTTSFTPIPTDTSSPVAYMGGATYPQVDTAEANPVSGTFRKAEFAYNYKPQMSRSGCQVIRAYVRFKGSSPQSMAEVMTEIIEDEEPDYDQADDTTRVYNKDISVYQYLTVTLDSTEDCEVKPEDPARQKLDPAEGNVWRWVITPKTNDANITLRLRVQAELPDGTPDRFRPVTIPIQIDLDGFFRRILIYLEDNPAVLWSAIVGLVGFAGGLIMWWLKRKGGGAA